MFVLNPHYVYINSRDRISGTDENFTYNMQFPPGLNSHMFECIDPNGVQVTVTVPIGSYLLNAFRTTIGSLLTAASPNGLTYTLTYPSISAADTGKWTYTQNNGAVVSSIIVNQHFFEPLGFEAKLFPPS